MAPLLRFTTRACWPVLFFFSLLHVAHSKTTRRYNFTVTYQWSKGDGHGRPIFAINGQSPGPLIEADEGDEIEVFLDNQLAFETTMHWHGIYQIDRPWNDGVPGVTQYSIQPRDNYTYRFTVDKQYGTYFYHGHFGPAFADGMRGPIWIRPSPSRPRPYGLISGGRTDGDVVGGMRLAEQHPHHIVISDWNAEPMDMLLVMYRDTGIVPWCSNSVVLNGKSRTYCHSPEALEAAGGPGRNTLGCVTQANQEIFANELVCEETAAPLEVVQVGNGQDWVWINFIHSGAHHELQISVDEHEFYVVAADGEFVHPQRVHAANCNLGERISILVRLDKKPGDYAIRLTSLRREQIIQGIGILRYPTRQHNARLGASSRAEEPMLPPPLPATEPWVHLNGSLRRDDLVAMDETKLAPYPERPPPVTADNTLKFVVQMTSPSSWVLNMAPHQAFRQQLPPVLWEASSRGKTTFGGASDEHPDCQHHDDDDDDDHHDRETSKCNTTSASTSSSHGLLLRNGTVVDIILENGAHVTSQHPFHKHNHKAWVIGTGTGGFPWASVDEAIREGGPAVEKRFNLVNPSIRDGCRLGNQTGDWTVIRYEISFPAASMMHCHMIHHFGAGQQVVLLEGIEAIPQIPSDLMHRVHSDFSPPINYGPLD